MLKERRNGRLKHTFHADQQADRPHGAADALLRQKETDADEGARACRAAEQDDEALDRRRQRNACRADQDAERRRGHQRVAGDRNGYNPGRPPCATLPVEIGLNEHDREGEQHASDEQR